MCKMFLDFGSHYGEGLSYFVNYYKINSDWLVETYEITPKSSLITFMCTQYLPVFENIRDVVSVVARGVSSFTGKKTLYVHKECDTGEGNNVIQGLNENIDIDGAHMLKSQDVDVVDINSILSAAVEKGATEFYIKMDIEGSEFETLERMLQSEHLEKIKDIHIEWHERFFPDKQSKTAKKQELIKKLQYNKIQIYDMTGCLVDSHLYYQEFIRYATKAINQV